MTDPIQDRMDALTAANVRLLRRVDELERRVAQLEGGADEAPSQPEPVVLPAPPPPPPVPEFTAPLPVFTAAAAPPEQPQGTLESTIGLNWVNRVGAVTLILGAAFFFKYAMDNEWIGPTGRILLGVLVGSLLCWFGYRSWAGRQTVFAQGVTAAGVAVLYLSFWASFSLYGLTPSALAFALMVAVTAMGGGFAWVYQAQAMAVIAYLAGVAAPFLVSKGEYHPWFFTSYLIVLNTCWLFVSRRVGWRWMEWTAAAATALLFSPLQSDLHAEDRGPVSTLWAMAQFGVFAFSPAPGLPVLALFLADMVVAGAWGNLTAQGFACLFALMAGGLWLAEHRSIRYAALVGTAGLAMGYLLLRADAPKPLPEATFLLGAGACFALLFVYTAWRMAHVQEPDELDLLLLVSPGALYFLAGFEVLSHGSEAWRGLFSAALAALYLGLAWRLHSASGERAEYDPRGVWFCVGTALTLATIAVAAQFDGFRITMLWALEAAALGWLAARYGQMKLGWAALAVSLLVCARLEAIDAPAYLNRTDLSLFWNSRFFTHLVSAGALAAAAWWIRASELALGPYLIAHAALLSGLAWENYTRVLQTTPAEGRMSAISIGLTILGAVYGLALVLAGVVGRFQLNRLLGLGLLAVVVAKLYLADVWSMERLHRIIAFGVLGLLLLATSYSYSRFRAKIEDWIRDDEPTSEPR